MLLIASINNNVAAVLSANITLLNIALLKQTIYHGTSSSINKQEAAGAGIADPWKQKSGLKSLGAISRTRHWKGRTSPGKEGSHAGATVPGRSVWGFVIPAVAEAVSRAVLVGASWCLQEGAFSWYEISDKAFDPYGSITKQQHHQ